MKSLFVLAFLFLIGFPGCVGNVTEYSMTIKVGDRSVTLPCRVEGTVDISQNVAWYRDEQQLTAGQFVFRDKLRIEVNRPGLHEWNLIIKNIQHNDAALYTCRVNSEDIAKVRLQIQTAPDINVRESTPGHFQVTELSSPTLTCKANGHPSPDITWYRKRQYEFGETTLGEEIGVTGSTLTIPNITRHGGDVYTCEAKNSIGEKTHEINVTVLFAPEVILLERQLEAVQAQQDPVVMTCVGQAAPLHDVYWWKGTDHNDRPLRIGSNWKYVVKSQTEPGYPLRIVTLMIRSKTVETNDFGTYKCRVEGKDANGEGAIAEDSVELRYRGAPVSSADGTETLIPYDV